MDPDNVLRKKNDFDNRKKWFDFQSIFLLKSLNRITKETISKELKYLPYL